MIDWDAFESLCQMHATLEEFCFFFKCCEETLNTKCREKYGMTFSAIFKERSVGGRMSLRREMWEGAMAKRDEKGGIIKPGNVTLQIFLSKQPLERGGLGFSDKLVNEHDIGSGTYEKLTGIVADLEAKKAAEDKR